MEYWPDGDITNPAILYDVREFAANNNGGYKRVPAESVTGYAALGTGPCLGSAIVKDSTGTAKWFAGSSSKIYQADGAGGWTDRSAAVSFSATTWVFQTFGDFTIAANGAHKLQVATTGNFADIAGAPTGPKIVYAHKNAIVALGSTANGAAWARSVTGDHTNYTAAANNDADAGTLYGGIGGPITAGCAFRNLAIAWKGAAMYAGTYQGNSDPDQDVIRWEVVSDKYGCVAQFAHVECEAGLVFVSQRDIMLFNGGAPVSIADKIRKRFLADAAANRARIFCTLDEVNNHVYIWISVSGTWNNRAFVWNYKTGQWGRLVTLNNNTGLLVVDARQPVRNANYQDYTALGGTTNSNEVCNLFFDASLHRAVNLAGTTYNAGGAQGIIKTGVYGRPDADTHLERVHMLSDSTQGFVGDATATVTAYGPGRATSTNQANIVLSQKAWFDVNKTARFFDIQIDFPSTEAAASLSSLTPEFSEADRKRAKLGGI